jgi:hypothetical protein
MIRVRICTNRRRCHNSCRRSRFSGLGTQICGKLFSSISLRSSRASLRSVFCFLIRLALISAGSPIHSSKPNSASSRSNQREYPVASMPTRTQIPRCFRSRVPFKRLGHNLICVNEACTFDSAAVPNSSIDAFPPISGEPTLSTGQCVSVAFSSTAVMGAWSEAINALPVL